MNKTRFICAIVILSAITHQARAVESGDVSAKSEAVAGFWCPAMSTAARSLVIGERRLTSIAFADDDRYLVGGTTDRLLIWETSSWQRQEDLETGYPVQSIASIPKTPCVVIGSALGNVEVFDLRERRRLFQLVGHSDSVLRVVCSPDGSMIASGGFDGVVRLWDVNQRQLVQKIEPGDKEKTIFALAIAPDGKSLVIRTQNELLIVWDITLKRERWRLAKLGTNAATVVFSADGTRFATPVGGNTVTMFNAQSGKPLFVQPTRWGQVYGQTQSNQLYVVEGAKISRLDSHTGEVKSSTRLADGWLQKIEMTADGRTMLTLDNESALQVHDLSPAGLFAHEITPAVSRQASVEGRYYDLLRILPAPETAKSVGVFHEAGYKAKSQDTRFGSIPAGFHVYAEPNWYVFDRSRIGLHHPPKALPVPVTLASGESRIWIGLPQAAFCSQAFAEAVSKLPKESKFIKRTQIHWKGFPLRFEYPSDRLWAPAILEVTMDRTMTTEKLLEELISLGYSLTDAEVFGEAEAKAAKVFDTSP